MEQIKPFQTKAFGASSPYDSEFSGRAIRAVGLRFAANLTGAAATFRDDASFRLLKTPEVNQAEQPLIRMAGPSWRHLSAITDGGYDNHVATALKALAMATIDLQKMIPNAMINASDKKCFLRGEFGALADYSGTAPATVVGTVRPFAVSSELDATQGFLRPKFSEISTPITNADDIQQVIRFEQDIIVHGLMLRAIRGSAAGAPNEDGLIKALRLDAVSRDGGNVELHRSTWGQARHYTQYASNFNQEDYLRSTGVVFIPTHSRAFPQYNGAMPFQNGDSLTVHFDAAGATSEEDFTGVTPASGDSVLITLVAFTPVAGTGDAQVQVPFLTAPQERKFSSPRSRAIRTRKHRTRLVAQSIGTV